MAADGSRDDGGSARLPNGEGTTGAVVTTDFGRSCRPVGLLLLSLLPISKVNSQLVAEYRNGILTPRKSSRREKIMMIKSLFVIRSLLLRLREGFVVLWGCRIGRLDLPHRGCATSVCPVRAPTGSEKSLIYLSACQKPAEGNLHAADADGSKGEDLTSRPPLLARHEARPSHRRPRTTRRILTLCHSCCCGCFAAVISIIDLQAKERRCILAGLAASVVSDDADR